VAVVQRHLGRRPHDDEHALTIEPEGVQNGDIGLESVQVVLLLEPWVRTDLGPSRRQALEAISRDRVRDDDPGCGAAAEAVLHRRELVVERVRRANPQGTGDEGQLVRSVRECEVEPSRARVGAERAQAAGQRTRLAHPAGAAVRGPDGLVLDSVQAEKLQGLCVLAGSHVDRVPAFAKQGEQRPKERDLRRVRDVDPDPHAARA
jgi:hypothetical protein